MKKIVFLVVLCLSFVYTKDAKDSQWRGFFGVEGGVGVFSSLSTFLGGINPVAINGYPLGLGYSVGILGGWQKYTSEKIGMRNTLGFKFSYVPNVTSIKNHTLVKPCFLFCKNNQEINISNSRGYHATAYYALDGLFDFVKSGNNRFGMSLGFGIDIFAYSYVKNFDGLAYLFGSLRMGFYTQFNNSVFEVNFKLPALGLDWGVSIYDSTLTLGYKYLF